MSIKTTGAEWGRFSKDRSLWNGGRYLDEECLIVDGKEWEEDESLIPCDAKVLIDGGLVYPRGDAKYDEAESLVSVFRAWRRRQALTTIVIEVPNERAAELKEAVKIIGGRVVGP